jgi:serine/threonine protein kinase
MTLPAGTRLGPYEILAPLGAGGMGEVYRARDERLGRQVAVKVLPAEVARDRERLRRFEHEARATGALDHPHVVAVHDVGTDGDTPYLVTELLEGETLRGRLAHGGLSLRRALDFAVQIARGLAGAHDRGIVHRDLKPENVFVTSDGVVKILDFGLAKLRPEASGLRDRLSELETLSGTAPGMLLGTVPYMSPEQAQGEVVDYRSDVFSFGAILYEMLSGRRAFGGGTALEVLNAIVKEEPPGLAETTRIPSSLERIVRHCLEKRREERFQSARDLAFALEAISAETAVTRGVPTRRNLRRLAVVTLVAVLLSAASVMLGLRLSSTPTPSVQQLTFRRGTIWSARFAPDGSTVVYGAAWEGRPFEVFTTRPGSPESRPLGLVDADLLSVSSSGEMALSLRPPVSVFPGYGTLARASLEGGAPREVAEAVLAADWAPGGEFLAVVRRAEGQSRLEYPVGTKLYETRSPVWISHPRVSPGGDAVAFLEHPNAADAGTVSVVDRAGRKRELSPGWFSVQGLAWSPSGREVWFTASRTGGLRALHAVDLSGRHRVVWRAPAALTLQDVARRGPALVAAQDFRVSTVVLPPGESQERDLSWFDSSMTTDMSPDGRLLVLNEAGEGAGTRFWLYLRRTDGSPAVRLGEGMNGFLSRDGRFVLAVTPGSPPRVVVWPAGPGEARAVPLPGIEVCTGAHWLPDGHRLVISGREAGHRARLYVQNIEGGTPRPFSAEGVATRPASNPVSPDATHVIAYGPDSKLALYPVDGGTPRPVPGAEPADAPIRFTADGRGVYLLRRNELPAKVYRVDLGTGARRLWKEVLPFDRAGVTAINTVLLTGDERSYAYSYVRQLSVLFLVEGLK